MTERLRFAGFFVAVVLATIIGLALLGFGTYAAIGWWMQQVGNK